MNAIADFLDSLYEYTEKHVVFRAVFFTFAIGLFISLLLVMFSMVCRPVPAYAASATANNNQELVAATLAGTDTIDIRALGLAVGAPLRHQAGRRQQGVHFPLLGLFLLLLDPLRY